MESSTQRVTVQTETVYTTKVIRKNTSEGKHINQYLRIRTIGEGPYSKIKLMKDIRTGICYAMKKYNLSILKKKLKMLKRPQGMPPQSVADDVWRQINLMKLLNHNNVIKLYEIIHDQEEEKVYLFMDYCARGDIAIWDSKKEIYAVCHAFKDEKALRACLIEIAKGVNYLHQNDIVHRDLKPQNILIDQDNHVKLIDFGLAIKLKPNQKLKGSVGTYHFMAPEMLSELFPDGYEAKRCDIWSLGVSFYGIVFGVLPFNDPLLIRLFQLIQQGKYKFPQIDDWRKSYVKIISQMLSLDPLKRPSADQLIKRLAELDFV